MVKERIILDGISEYIFTIIRSLIALLILLSLTRIIGKKQLSQFTFFDFIAAITTGSIAAAFAVRTDGIDLLHALIALIFWVIAVALLGWRKLSNVEPAVLIRKGVVQEKELSNQRLTLQDLTALLRREKIFSLSAVEYAILERDGSLSAMMKSGSLPVTKADLQLPLQTARNMPTTVVVDGKIVSHEMNELGLSPDWLIAELRNRNITSVTDVFYAEYLADGTLAVQKKTGH